MTQGAISPGKLPGDLLAELLEGYPIEDTSVVVGPGVGIDAAVVDAGGELIVVKSDPITFAREKAPQFLVNVNANDLACMGATPRWLLVTALLPAGSTTVSGVRALFEELNLACRSLDITLIGGHTEVLHGVDRPILVGNLLGTVSPDRLLKPGLARPGDRLLLTRPIAIEGSALIANELHDDLVGRVPEQVLERAAGFLNEPGISVVRDAITLLGAGVVSALHDPTEGGIAMGVRELAVAARAGALVSRGNVPVLPESAAIANALGLDPLGMLASGSLLAAVPPDKIDAAERACQDHQIPMAWIGKIAPPERGFTLRDGTEEIELPLFPMDEVARALATGGHQRHPVDS